MATESGNFPDLLSTSEAAELLAVSVSTLHRWRETGRITEVRKLSKATGSYLFNRVDVVALSDALKADAA